MPTAIMLKEYYARLLLVRKLEAELKDARVALAGHRARREEALRVLSASREPGQDTCEVLQAFPDGEVVVRTSAGPRYLTNKRAAVPLAALRPGARVSVSAQSLTIMHALPPAVDPQVFRFSHEQGASPATFADVGGLAEEVRLIREAVELPLTNPELFEKVGIEPPRAVLLTGPPGTGKSLLCQALSNALRCTFVKLVGSQLIQRYIGESSRLIRDMFAYARQNAPAVVMIDEVDSICGARANSGGSSDREVARAMLSLLTELDGVQSKDNSNRLVKCVFCTNRPQALDPAFLRPGRISRKIAIPLPDAAGRYEILRIHGRRMRFDRSCDFARVVAATEGLNGADLRNLLTEAGLCAIRAGRGAVAMDDLLEAVRVLQKNKALEGQGWDQGNDAMNR